MIAKNAFSSWHSYSTYRQREKIIKAEICWHNILKRRALYAWILYVQNEKSKMLVAIDWHALRSMEHWFARWHKYSTHCRMIEDSKTRQAISHHEW